MGLDQAFIERSRARAETKKETTTNFHIWFEHVPTWNLFLKLRRQFIIGGMGGYFGIPIMAKESLFNIEQTPLEDRSQLLDDIQLVEDGALQELNKKDGK
ncbi:DUF1799 domain-containing protein [Colwellia sp. 6_MG-2023]|jgi:hypothetical protein|uniref:DUF1799 domain-containing protein n=1 Tax=Colwellia sp. 6_MG-2023 TaxID=3062676 RepID=UPI0026E36E65|nr:DUF1799 domain-containing protein [Colwellia sp. 6_MG-2023]MDO6489295.1 DUF1799 domain-containing protein [Colwellia sp. 6_MG-2023]